MGEPATEIKPPVNDWPTDVTVPKGFVPQDVSVPSVVRYLPLLPVWLGTKALNAALAVV